jgi:hypothetical protein
MSEEAVVEVPVAPVAAVVPATAETPETPAVETPPAPPTAEELQKKFDRDAAMQRRRYEKDLQAEREQRIRLEERLAKAEPARPADPGMPTIDKFDNFDEYVTAKAEYIASQTLSKHEQRQQQEKAQAAQHQTVEGWNKRVAAADIPDFHDVVASSDVPMTRIMQQAIMESDNGPKLAYHLATNPADAERIAGMTPIGAVRALTLIEEGLKKPVAVSKATPPITPVGSKATSIKSLLDVKDYDEFSKRRAAQIAKRR